MDKNNIDIIVDSLQYHCHDTHLSDIGLLNLYTFTIAKLYPNYNIKSISKFNILFLPKESEHINIVIKTHTSNNNKTAKFTSFIDGECFSKCSILLTLKR